MPLFYRLMNRMGMRGALQQLFIPCTAGAAGSHSTMPIQGTALHPQHGAGVGEFHLESFKVSIWHLWLHLQFKLVYFLLFSFYSTEFSACERCWIVISGDWNLFIYPCNRYTLSSGNVILPLSNTTPSRVPDAEELSLRSENNGQFSCSCSSIND